MIQILMLLGVKITIKKLLIILCIILFFFATYNAFYFLYFFEYGHIFKIIAFVTFPGMVILTFIALIIGLLRALQIINQIIVKNI